MQKEKPNDLDENSSFEELIAYFEYWIEEDGPYFTDKDSPYKIMEKDVIIDEHRWYNRRRTVLKHLRSGRYLAITYSTAATENQDVEYNSTFYEVIAEVVTVLQFTKKV